MLFPSYRIDAYSSFSSPPAFLPSSCSPFLSFSFRTFLSSSFRTFLSSSFRTFLSSSFRTFLSSSFRTFLDPVSANRHSEIGKPSAAGSSGPPCSVLLCTRPLDHTITWPPLPSLTPMGAGVDSDRNSMTKPAVSSDSGGACTPPGLDEHGTPVIFYCVPGNPLDSGPLAGKLSGDGAES